MTIWNHKQDGRGNWIVTKDDKKIIDVPNQALGEELELIFAEIEEEYLTQMVKAEASIQARDTVIQYYQEIILKVIEDKLSDIDTMYALKTLLKETADTLKDTIEMIERTSK